MRSIWRSTGRVISRSCCRRAASPIPATAASRSAPRARSLPRSATSFSRRSPFRAARKASPSGSDGTVSVTLQGQSQPSQVGTIQLASFINPAGLQNTGNNLATQTQASGAPVTGQPTLNGLGSVAQGYLEGSNVSVVDEMIDMIATQRAYELNTEAAKGVDQMLNYLTQATS